MHFVHGDPAYTTIVLRRSKLMLAVTKRKLKGKDMSFVSNIRGRMAKRAEYKRTLFELTSMPEETARDLNIARADMPRIAHQAVYGG
ncbi:hypothetical protein SSE37_25223 [Sagittula stellata E-37]|uniref:DUF1127 domain-containing protein n=2 Tax=Sagittula stellata TaxID=52603 RepID=A3KA28_SAGS3|nr:hypothetical protein SSE37_25223 [Sagittula stellata E-37]